MQDRYPNERRHRVRLGTTDIVPILWHDRDEAFLSFSRQFCALGYDRYGDVVLEKQHHDLISALACMQRCSSSSSVAPGYIGKFEHTVTEIAGQWAV